MKHAPLSRLRRVLCFILAFLMLPFAAFPAVAVSTGSYNFALGQQIEATNSYHPAEGFFSESFLNDGEWLTYADGNVKLGWNTDPYSGIKETDPVDITIRLDGTYTLEKIVLCPMKWGNGEGFPRDFSLLGSTDGKTWFDVYAPQTNVNVKAADNLSVKPLEYVPDTPVEINYFRMHITRHSEVKDANGSASSALGEIELYGYESGELRPSSINKTALRMNPGETDWLELITDRRQEAITVSYKSSNESVVKVDADGTVHAIAEGEAVITTRDVTNGVDFTTTVLVDNFRVEDQFNIVTFMPYFWAEEVNADYFDLLQKSGVTNIELNFAFDANAITYENNLKAIELAYERGMDVTVSEVDFSNATWPSKTKEQIYDFVKKYSHRPGVTGFYIEDESGTSWIYAQAMATIKEIMPYAVTHVNYCGAYADNARALYNELAKYGEGLLDYVMYDLYCFRSETCDENSMYSSLEYNRRIGQELNTPTAFYVQSMAWNNCYRPNGDDIRYQVWAGLAYGAKQFSYFCYHTPRANAAETYGPAIVDLEGNPTDLYEPVSELNWQIRAIGDTLMKLETKVVYHTGVSFGGSYNALPAGYYLKPVDRDQKLTVSRMVDTETGREYGIMVNRDYNKPQTVRFTLDEDVGSISYISTETGEPVLMTPDKDGVYTVELLAGEGVLLQLDEDYDFLVKDVTDYYYLNKAIETADSLDLSKYRPDGQEEFKAALAEAKTVAADTKDTQTKVNSAVNALNKAMAALRMKAAEGVNLAQGASVSATSSYEEGTYFMKKFLTDGVQVPMDENQHQGWSVDPFDVLGENETVDVILDLELEYAIDAVILRPAIYCGGTSFPRDYTVEVSTDKESWVKIGEGKNVTMTEVMDQAYDADSVPGRYVRIRITRHSALVDATGGYLSQIGEIEVYGKDRSSDPGTTPEPDTAPDTTPDSEPVTDPDTPPAENTTKEPSEAPTREPDTAAPTDEAPSEPAERKGCGATLGIYALLTSALAAAWVLKRRDTGA